MDYSKQEYDSSYYDYDTEKFYIKPQLKYIVILKRTTL